MVSLLLCLAKNPEKQAKLREEIKKHLPSRDSEINEAVLKNMTYLKACLKESLRMYPLIPRNIRVLNNNVVLSGYEVPKGTHVVMVSGPLMQDETYFPRGKEFLPERWLRQSANSSDTFRECTRTLKPSSPFIYLPFGFGPRSCIGRRIAEMELEMCTARLIRNFHVEFNYPIDNPFRCTVISIPNIALKFQFTDVEN